MFARLISPGTPYTDIIPYGACRGVGWNPDKYCSAWGYHPTGGDCGIGTTPTG